VKAVAIELDGALGDTGPLWRDWLEDVTRRVRLDVELPQDPQLAVETLDRSVGNWQQLLERFASDRAPVYLRPNAAANAALRRLEASGIRLGLFTAVPEPLARVAAAQLGAARRVEALEAGPGALERLLERLGAETRVARSRDELLSLVP
jgi:phosphoglycolate phosphatase-like HAD superfamily hydrolase